MRANASELQCQIRALNTKDSPAGIDYALVDFLGFHLKPQVYEASIGAAPARSNEYAMLFTRNALRGSVKHLVYEVSKS